MLNERLPLIVHNAAPWPARAAHALVPRRCRPAGGAEGAAAGVAAAGGVGALVAGLSNNDPQASCFAAAGVSALARLGGSAAKVLAGQPALANSLLAMVQAPLAAKGAQQRAAGPGGPGGRQWSPGVAAGVQRCGLRALLACCGEQAHLRPALRAAGVAAVVQVSHWALYQLWW